MRRIPVKFIFSALAFLALPWAAHASESRAFGRVYVYSCGYYSNRAADVAIYYRNDELTPGTHVAIRYAFGGEDAGKPFDWKGEREFALKPIAPGYWSFKLSQTLDERGSPRHLNALNFVYVIRLADGQQIIDNGIEQSPVHAPGFFHIALEGGDCVNGTELPQPARMWITRVDR